MSGINGWYMLSVPAWLLVFFIATARANDIKTHRRTAVWQVRIIGLSATMGVAVIMLCTPWTLSGLYMPSATWRGTLMSWAWAATWATTPGLPPLAKYLTGKHRKEPEYVGNPSVVGRVTGEFRALRDSARPRSRTWDGSERRKCDQGDND